MRIGIILLLFIAVGFPSFAMENKTSLPSEKLITPQEPKTVSSADTSYDLEKWRVKEEKIVADAMDVFKRKAQPIHSKRVWIYDKNGEKSFLVEYTPNTGNPKVIFSNDEDFAFFVGLSGAGESVIYGFDLSSGNQYPIDTASHFDMITCPKKKKSYVVVNKGDGSRNTYFIYNLNGEKRSVLDAVTPENIKNKVCY